MHHILTRPLILQTPLIKQQTQAKLHIRTESHSRELFKNRGYSLQVLGPGRRVRHGHEEAVGQDGEHYEQTEQPGKRVKEAAPWRAGWIFVFANNAAHRDMMFLIIL